MIPTICRLVLCCRVRVRVRLMLLHPNSLRHPRYWHSKFHNKLFSLFPKQHTTSLHIVGIMEKYDHIQTGLEKIFGLYGVFFSGIYDSIQIRKGVGLYGVVLYSVGLYGGGYSTKYTTCTTIYIYIYIYIYIREVQKTFFSLIITSMCLKVDPGAQ